MQLLTKTACGLFALAIAAQDAKKPESRFAEASFEQTAAAAPAGDSSSGAKEASATIEHRRFTVRWPASLALSGNARSRRSAALAGAATTLFSASHPLTDDERSFDLQENANFSLDGDERAQGSVRSGRLLDTDALLDAIAYHPTQPNLRLLGLAKRKETPSPEEEPLPPLPVRRGSVYPISTEGHRLDAYFLRDAAVASELLPSLDNFSIAGAGDRPRRFMRGHRFLEGDGTIVGIRYSDPDGNTLHLSIALPKNPPGALALPGKGVSVAITELSANLEIGRISERVGGSLEFIHDNRGATLRLALDADLRRVGARDPERILVFGEFRCVALALDELTPWLGRYVGGRPILETFAQPGEWDR